MRVEVVLPKVDMDMETGILVAWKVAEGDAVRAGDILFEMETNKSVMEVEAPAAGTIRELAPVTGEPLEVGTRVAWIDTEEDAPTTTPGMLPQAEPVASLPPTDRDATRGIAQAPPAPPTPTEAEGPGNATDAVRAIRATPLARSSAKRLGIDLTEVTGSGPQGRIVAADVESARSGAGAAPESVATSVVPFSPIRRIVAAKLAESARSAPHFYMNAHIEMGTFLAALRTAAPAVEAACGARPTLTIALAGLLGRLLAVHRGMNVSVGENAIHYHDGAHVGIAMDRDGELVVPVLRHADRRSLLELTREYIRLRDAVRTRSIVPADMRGGTFTLSNLGMYGVDGFTAIINPPESAILAVGRTVETPVGRDGGIFLRPMANFTLSSDHRIIDGVMAARFMADLRKHVENPPDWLTTS